MYSGLDRRPDSIKVLLKKFGFKLFEAIDAKQITARFHPHVQRWRWWSPHVVPFFGYIAAEKTVSPTGRWVHCGCLCGSSTTSSLLYV